MLKVNVPRDGRPKIATTPEIIEPFHNIGSVDRSLTKRNTANAIGNSDKHVLHILHGKLFGKLLPHTLAIQQKLNRKQISQHNLERFKQNKKKFLHRFITMDLPPWS